MIKHIGVLVTALVLSSLASGQLLSPLTVATYRGDVTTRSNGDNAFELVIAKLEGEKIEGTIQFWKGEASCRRVVPVTGTVRSDGTIVIEAPHPMKGCDRTFTIKRAGDQTVGEIQGPLGLTGFALTKR